MVTSSRDVAVTVLGIIGNITSMGLFVSPMPTFYEICKKKTTGGYSALPYVATLLNCMLWTFYGAPAVAGLIFVVSINVAGLILETIYVFIHFLFGNKIGRRMIAVLMTLISLMYGAMVALVLDVVKKHDRAEVVGSICVIIGVLMYAAPLAVMTLERFPLGSILHAVDSASNEPVDKLLFWKDKVFPHCPWPSFKSFKEVIRSQSVESMPFLLSFACFCNGLVWTAYGTMKNDKFIYIPNGLGTFLTTLQLVLWCIYYKKGKRKAESASLAAQHAIDIDKFAKECYTAVQPDLSSEHPDLAHNPKKSLPPNDTALMALTRDK